MPREVARELEVVGRTPQEEFQAAEQWIIGKYAYLSSIMAGRVWVYDISDPAKPVKVDSVSFDARVINDVSTTADGRIAVITREGASNRKNGIVFLDLADPAHPKVLSEYTETVTGGVHSAYVNGHYVYLTDDATGSLRVIDFADPAKPKEVARWQTENPLARPVTTPEGETFIGGRMLHDVQVVDGLIYMGYWKDGLVILDVGNGIKGGSPEHPQFVSQLRFNYSELYGPGWLAGAHSVFRYKNYVFLGDEVFPVQYDLTDKARIPTKGIVHVVDVSDILNPRKVAEYDITRRRRPQHVGRERRDVHRLLRRRRSRRRRVGRTARKSIPAGTRDGSLVDGRRERIPAEHFVRLGSAAARWADLLQRHPHWNLGDENDRSSRTGQTTEALTVDGPQDVDAASLWTDVDAAHHRQGREVENFDRARLGRNAFHGDERVAVIR